jgi:hypothetical protein
MTYLMYYFRSTANYLHLTKLVARGWSVDEALFGSMTETVDQEVEGFNHE